MIKRIPGYQGYWADTKGEIYSSWKLIDNVWQDCGEPFKQLKSHISFDKKRSQQRRRVHLQIHKKRKCLFVHRAVALAHLPNPRNLPLVRHLDDNSMHNDVSNLQWGSEFINVQDRQRNAKADERIRTLEYELAEYKNKITVADLYATESAA